MNTAKQLGYDSMQELYFKWYLEELREHGIVGCYIYHPDSIVLSKEVRAMDGRLLLDGHKYTCDFKIQWIEESKYYRLFTQPFNLAFRDWVKNPFYEQHCISHIEIKPLIRDTKTGKLKDPHGSRAKTTVDRKWVLKNTGIFVQEIMCPKLFKKTFYPKRFLADRTGKKTNSYKLLEDFLEINKK